MGLPAKIEGVVGATLVNKKSLLTYLFTMDNTGSGVLVRPL